MRGVVDREAGEDLIVIGVDLGEGEVAPDVRKTRFAAAASLAAASTMSVSERPMRPAILGTSAMSARVLAAMIAGLVSPSTRRSITLRPSTPPFLLARATASCAPCAEGTSRSFWPPLRL